MFPAILMTWSAAYAATSLFAYLRARRFFTAPSMPIGDRPAALVIRPCAGDEAHLRENLATTALAAKAGDAIVFAIASFDDGAARVASEVCADLVVGGFDARVVITGAVAANRKADQIARVLSHGTPRAIVVIADSDVALAPGDIDALVAPFSSARVAATWAPPCETGDASLLGDRAARAVMSGSLHAFPLLAGLDAHGMVGKLFALRITRLAEIGGFDALSRHLGEDMELARRLRDIDCDVVCVSRVAHARASGRSFGDTALRFTRWLSVIRAQRPLVLATYPLFFFALPFFILGAIAFPTPLAFAALASALVARVAIAAVASRIAGFPASFRRMAVDTVLGETTLFVAFCGALFTRKVRWRDRTLHFDRRGLLAATEER